MVGFDMVVSWLADNPLALVLLSLVIIAMAIGLERTRAA